MTQENRSALENALDVFVYAPLGLAMTAIEELPKLAEKGRTQVEGQITIARVVGKFAIAQGRRQLERRLGTEARQTAASGASGAGSGRVAGPGTTSVTANGTTPARSAADDRLPETQGQPLESELIDSDGGYEKLSGHRDTLEATGRNRDEVAGASPISPIFGRPAPSADQLAIPGYDSLSASQVVQRLAGLSKDELEAVGAYESAHRARRTVLTRVNQLKA